MTGEVYKLTCEDYILTVDDQICSGEVYLMTGDCDVVMGEVYLFRIEGYIVTDEVQYLALRYMYSQMRVTF